MNEEDRKFLTEWGGECWHKVIAEQPYEIDTVPVGSLFECSCGLKFHANVIGKHVALSNRTFDTWNDFGWLIEKLGTTKLLWNFVSHWRQGGGGKYFDAPITQMVEWEVLKPGIRCQLICDFLREQEITDTLAIKEQEGEG